MNHIILLMCSCHGASKSSNDFFFILENHIPCSWQPCSAGGSRCRRWMDIPNFFTHRTSTTHRIEVAGPPAGRPDVQDSFLWAINHPDVDVVFVAWLGGTTVGCDWRGQWNFSCAACGKTTHSQWFVSLVCVSFLFLFLPPRRFCVFPSHPLRSRPVRWLAGSRASIRPRRAMTERRANVGWSPAVSHRRRDNTGDRPSVTRSSFPLSPRSLFKMQSAARDCG